MDTILNLSTSADTDKEFKVSAGRARQMISKGLLSPDEIADIHGIFQQATVGDCNNWKFLSTAGQQLFDINSKNKHCLWASYRGMSKLEAMKLYTDKVQILVVKYGVVFPDDPRRRYGSAASVCTTSTYLSSYKDRIN